MKLAQYEKVTSTIAIAIMIAAIALWVHYFRFVIELYIELGVHVSIWDILRAWYAQILQVLVDIIGLILLLLFRKKGLRVALGVCSVIIAAECALDAYLLLVEYKDIFGDEPAMFLQGAISLVIAAMLFFNGILYSVGATKGASLIKYASVAIIILQVLTVITEIREGTSINFMISEREYDFPSYLLLFLTLHMSMSKYTSQTSLVGIIRTSIRDLRNSMMVEGVGIDRDIAVRFSNYNKEGLWCNSYSFIIMTFNNEKYSMSLVRVGENMVGRITSVENDSGMNVFRFNITGVWFDTADPHTCDLMRFYGMDGMFIQLIVRDGRIYRSKGIPKFGAVRLSSMEEGTYAHKYRVKITAVVTFVMGYVRKIVGFVSANTIGRIRRGKEKEE